MRTDSFFPRFFRKFPGAFFTMIGEDTRKARGYKFRLIEVKELSFRFDGVFLPSSPSEPIFFVEVQFRKKADFYPRFFAKTALYVQHHQPKNRWRAVVIFPRRSIDPGVNHHYQEFFESGRLQRVYLNELPKEELEKFPLNLLRIILDSKRDVIATTEKIVRQLSNEVHNKAEQETIIQMLINLLMSKFTKLSRKEIESTMEPFLSDIRKSRAYREIAREGKKEKAREIAKTLLQKKMSLAFVVEVTGLSPNEVRAVQKNLAARKN